MVGIEVASFIFGAILLTIALLGGAIDISFLQIGTKGPIGREMRAITGILGLSFIVIGFIIRPVSLPPVEPTPIAIATLTQPANIVDTTPTRVGITPQTTSSPAATPTNEDLLSAVTAWDQVVIDSFNSSQNKYNWFTGTDKDEQGNTAEISLNGKYYIDIRTTSGKTWSPFLSNIETPSAFFLEADIKRTKENGCYAALVWGGDSRISFRVDDVDREYSLNIYDSLTKEYVDLKGWGFHEAIRTGEANRLSVISDGKAYMLYINDEYVTSGVINTPQKGSIGVQTSVCNQNSQVTFEFDNLEIRIPPANSSFSINVNPSMAFFDQGYRSYADKQYDNAIDSFNNALNYGYPAAKQAYYYIGRSYSSLGRHTDAVVYYTKAVEEGYQPLSEAYNRRGLAQKSLKSYAQAIDDFTKSIELGYKPITWPYINRADAKYDNGDYASAIEDYTTAIELKHEPLGRAYVSRASAYKKSGDIETAFQDYESAIQLGYLEAYEARGRAFAEQKDYLSAIEDYTKAIENDYTGIYVYYYRGEAYQKLGDKEKAKADFEKFLSMEGMSESWREAATKKLEELDQ